MSEALSRRRLLQGAAVAAGCALAPVSLDGLLSARAGVGDYPFTLGVASGDPLPDGFVIWSRLAPRPLQGDGGMPARPVQVRWIVAEDARLSRVVASGETFAQPTAGHSIHVEVEGLRPGREYWYRFTAGGEASPVGRACTTPPAGASVDRLRACFTSCQKYEAGFYAGYRHLAAENPDLILFLGDYIYEGDPGSRNAVRLHQNPEPTDIGGYRVRYATYKSDPLLQAAHAVAPWLVLWDDHEVVNDYGGDRDGDVDPALFLRRRAAAYQAYFEHMPLRRTALPVGPSMLLHRAVDWGALAQFQLIDDRQHRDAAPCAQPGQSGKLIADCDARRDPARSILGERQEAWLMDTLDRTPARWNLLTQQTLFGPLELRDPANLSEVRFSNDGWDGYPATRERIIARWIDAGTQNPLVLGGDIHAFASGSVRRNGDGPVVASEFVGGSMTSLGMDAALARRVQALNPRLEVYETGRRGYGRLDLTPGRAEIAFRALDDARDAESGLSTLNAFVIENGRPGAVAA
ncbi:alkaline phosphatase [Brevundimonas sp. PAMC22021]|uniref:alkaline phosphatase D family protein n=1 Tax=Brevundimonas sp. PAMC22021 TaxID=2861285 RepID=UPI001C632DD5|nr:alkaline phosphatase D family protein [Brevundimonas sp. PAMC22021]QYF85812.1 alkaline phosphatase D family protein [Brevundimonas sp. PAMC22021]